MSGALYNSDYSQQQDQRGIIISFIDRRVYDCSEMKVDEEIEICVSRKTRSILYFEYLARERGRRIRNNRCGKTPTIFLFSKYPSC